MLYAYFGGLGADKVSRYELLLEHDRMDFSVTAVDQPYRPQSRLIEYVTRWSRSRGRRLRARTVQLYRGPDGQRALMSLFRAARAANLNHAGQRFCYVLPSAPAHSGALAALLPRHLRYDGGLPVHPQLWQVGSSLDTLPIERHAQACTDIHLYAEWRSRWTRV